jgi:hypothetical protein
MDGSRRFEGPFAVVIEGPSRLESSTLGLLAFRHFGFYFGLPEQQETEKKSLYLWQWLAILRTHKSPSMVT